MALIATVGDPAANAFLTAADAWGLFLSTELNPAAWLAAPSHEQDAALITATRLIVQAVDWYSGPFTTTQALPWPQAGATDRYGRAILTTVVPDDIKRATALYALALLQHTATAMPLGMEGLEEIDIKDQVSLRFRAAMPASPFDRVPPSVRALLSVYGDVVGGATVRLVRT